MASEPRNPPESSLAEGSAARSSVPWRSAAGADEAEGALRAVVAERLREYRSHVDWTLNQLAGRSGVSKAMLSKIENAQTTPTLATLARIGSALSVPVTAFFRGLDEEHDLLHVKAGQGLEIQHRGSSAGHRYQLLGRMRFPHDRLEPTLVTIESDTDHFPLYQHGGSEFLFMITGSLEYGYAGRTVLLEPGDALQFLGEVPHGPIRALTLPVQLLSLKVVTSGTSSSGP
jgi:transcriptional regulator with XRE-family HTH domain